MLLSESQRNSLEQATTQFQRDLATDPEAQEYLRGRGLDPDAVGYHRLGVVRNPPVGYESFRGRLSIPYITPTGVVDVRFRSLERDAKPRYLNRPNTTVHLYNVRAFEVDSSYIAVTEGEFDAVTAQMCGIPTVGVPGANNWKSFWHRAFSDYESVFLLCDGDTPGHNWGGTLAKDIENAIIVHMPEGHDVNSIYLQDGVDGIRKRCGL